MKIDLGTIEAQPVEFDERVELAPERLDQDLVAGTVSVRLVGAVRAAASGFVVEGSFEAAGPLVCARCLEPVPWQAAEEFRLELRPAPGPMVEVDRELDEGELDVTFLDGDELDLNTVAAEQVLLALPMRIVCDDTCAGLCPRCGANRNVAGACRCEPEPDPRWQTLHDLAGRNSAN